MTDSASDRPAESDSAFSAGLEPVALTEPASLGPAPALAPPRSRFKLGLLAVLGLVVGAALRWWAAARVQPGPAEFEGWLAALETAPWPHEAGLRTAGYGAVMEWLGAVFEVAELGQAKLLGFGFSLVGGLGAVLSAVAVSQRLGFAQRRASLAVSACAWVWALHPSWVLASSSASPDALVAAVLPWLPIGIVAASGRRPWLGAALLATLLGATLSVGGVIWATATAVGLLVYLAPVPKPAAALRALVIVAAAFSIWAWSEQVPLAEAPSFASVDTGWAYSALEWLDPEHQRYQEDSLPPGKRHREVVLSALEAFQQFSALELLPVALTRLRNLGVSPGRFGAVSDSFASVVPPAATRWSLTIFELLLRGGLLLFAIVVASVFRPAEPSSGWPRGAFVAFFLVALILTALFALSTAAWLALDTLMLSLAAAGLVGAGAGGRRTRWGGFLLGGGILVSFLVVTGLEDSEINQDLWDRNERFDQGQRLTDMLSQTEDLSLDEELLVANLFLDMNTPLLRQPRLALAHATTATHLSPLSDETVVAMCSALTALGRYTEAARLLSQALEAKPGPSKRLDVMLSWVQEMERLDRRPAVR